MPILGGYDGSIKIDSSINSKGFNAGIKSMLGSLSKLGAALAVVFGARAIFMFGKNAVDEASSMASALIGLQSIVEGTGNSFSKAREFLTEYTEDGLIPLANASLALKNLLARGYSIEQATKTLDRLKNAAAFSRQSHLSMGQAVQSATEGLKNENSILVDNAGVTKNVSMMWKDYAASIGTTVGMLTKEQKIQAEVNGIAEETRFQMNDAAKASKTYAGQVSALGVSIVNLKVAIGKTLIPFITSIIPYVKALIDNLTVYFNRLALFVSVFFGVDLSPQATQMQQVADTSESAASAQEDLGNETAKAAKKAKGALATWDELNVLQQQDTDTLQTPEVITPDLDTNVAEEGLDDLRIKVQNFKEQLMELFGPAIESFDKLKTALEPIRKLIVEGLGWAWENVLVPIGRWAIEEVLPRMFDLMRVGVENLNIALDALRPLGKWLWENFLVPLGKWTGELILKALDFLIVGFEKVGKWVKNNEEVYRALVVVVLILGAALIAWILGPITLVIAAIIAVIAVITNWGRIWDWLKQKGRDAAQFIRDDFKYLASWFSDNVINPIRNRFETALNSIRDMFSNAFSGIGNITRNAFNGMIDIINGLLNRIATAMNNMANIVNQFSWMLGGLRIPLVTAPNIPHLAAGAVIPPNAEFLAVMGDQRSGRNIEAPENLIRQIIREELGSSNGGTVEVTIPVTLDGEVIFKNQQRVSARHGNSLLSSGTV